jgi:hypothetical protein
MSDPDLRGQRTALIVRAVNEREEMIAFVRDVAEHPKPGVTSIHSGDCCRLAKLARTITARIEGE